MAGLLYFESSSSAQRVLTLDMALSQAMSQNPSILQARANVQANKHKTLQVRAGFLPQANIALSYNRATANSPAPPYINVSATNSSASSSASPLASLGSLLSHETSDSYNNYAASVTVSQTLWDFGRTSNAYHASQTTEQASQKDLRTVQENLWLLVTQSFYGVLARQELVESTRETKRQMEKHLELAKAHWAAGTKQKIDVTRAMSDLSSANLALVRAQNAYRLAQVSLNNAMGVSETANYLVERPSASSPLSIPSMKEALTSALAKRSDYQSILQKIKAVELQKAGIRSNFYPVLGASGNLNYKGYTFDDFPYNWAVGGTLTWNAFAGFQTVHAVKEAEENLAALRANLQSFENTLQAEIESAISAYREAEESFKPAQALLASAKETLELAEGRYQAGAGNIIEVTDAQAIMTQAKTSLIQTQYDWETARARVIKALGQLPDLKGKVQ